MPCVEVLRRGNVQARPGSVNVGRVEQNWVVRCANTACKVVHRLVDDDTLQNRRCACRVCKVLSNTRMWGRALCRYFLLQLSVIQGAVQLAVDTSVSTHFFVNFHRGLMMMEQTQEEQQMQMLMTQLQDDNLRQSVMQYIKQTADP